MYNTLFFPHGRLATTHDILVALDDDDDEDDDDEGDDERDDGHSFSTGEL
jgi:hypothetical protein